MAECERPRESVRERRENKTAYIPSSSTIIIHNVCFTHAHTRHGTAAKVVGKMGSDASAPSRDLLIYCSIYWCFSLVIAARVCAGTAKIIRFDWHFMAASKFHIFLVVRPYISLGLTNFDLWSNYVCGVVVFAQTRNETQ